MPTTSGLTRREALASLGLASAWPVWLRANGGGPILIAAGAIGNEALEGVRFGIEEAARTASLLDVHVELVPAGSVTAKSVRSVAALLVDAVDARTPRMDVPVVTLASADGPRTTPCHFSIAFSPARKRALVDQWFRASPRDVQAAVNGATVIVEEWDGSLVKFGAGELNERFARVCRHAMTSSAWRGWAAVKAVVEAQLRASRSSACDAVAAVAFDGHKGAPLRFDPVSGELGQPVYLVRRDRGGSRILAVL
jgi:hypothetical protein